MYCVISNSSPYKKKLPQPRIFLSLLVCPIEKNRDIFEPLMDVKVTMKRKMAVILGFAGSGKSHTLALLLDKEPPSMRVSTSCTETPIRAIGLKRYKKEVSSKVYSEVDSKTYSQMMMKSGKDILGSVVQKKGIIGKWKKIIKKKKKVSDLTQIVEDGLIDTLSTPSTDSVKPLIDEFVVEMVDSGGQPQFLEILPRFIDGLDLAIVVINLSERLDQYPISYYYGKDGKPVGKGEPSKLTNKQMLHQFLQMVVSYTQEKRQIQFIIVGTHRDLEHTCKETREDRERALSEMVRSLGLRDNAIYADREGKKLIFAINAKDPKVDDHRIGQKIMEVVMDDEEAEIVTVPVKNHLLEETLTSMSTTGEIAFTMNEVMQNVGKYFKNKKSLKKSLKYLDQYNRIFYFNELFPDKVFGEPQAVLNMVTEVVMEHIKLTTGVDTGRVIDGAWRKFKEQAIITENILKKISVGYSSHFTPMDMLKLLEKLLIVFKRIPGEFLMPCLLSAETSKSVFDSQTADPMLHIPMMLHFPRSTARIGIFCSMVCKLISTMEWEHHEHSDVARNNFSFTRPSGLGIVCLQDSYDSFFQVTLHFPSDPELYHKLLPSTCVAVRDTVKEVINLVTEVLHYVPDQPVLAFECVVQHKARYSLHAAKYIEGEIDYLICTREPSSHGKVTDDHRLWLGQGMCVAVEDVVSEAVVTAYRVCDKSCLIFLAGVPVSSGQHSSLIASPQKFLPGEFPIYITNIQHSTGPTIGIVLPIFDTSSIYPTLTGQCQHETL